MGVDYYTCSNCSENYPDCGHCGTCQCEEGLCGYCYDKFCQKYGVIESKWYGKVCASCDHCAGVTFTAETLLKKALERMGITQEEFTEWVREQTQRVSDPYTDSPHTVQTGNERQPTETT